MQRYFDPGEATTEYRKAVRAEVVGFFLVVCGLGCIAVAIFLDRMVENVAGIGLAFSGAYILARSSEGYSSSRGAVKAAALAPPGVEHHERRL